MSEHAKAIDVAMDEARRSHWHREGYEAGRSGKSFDDCPYTFAACGYSKEAFNRDALNLWFRGWQKAREGL